MINLSNYQEALEILLKYKNEKKAAFYKKIINDPYLEYIGLDAKSMNEVIKKYSLFSGPLDLYYELTALILWSNLNNSLDEQTTLNYVLSFIPYVNNWAFADCLLGAKIKNISYTELFPQIKHLRYSTHIFERRLFYTSMMIYKEEPTIIKELLLLIQDDQEYYVQMAIAWTISEFYHTLKKEIIEFIINSNLSSTIKLKAIQKIIDSNKTTKQEKENIKDLRKAIKKG